MTTLSAPQRQACRCWPDIILVLLLGASREPLMRTIVLWAAAAASIAIVAQAIGPWVTSLAIAAGLAIWRRQRL